ncbi:hypothetical protein CDV36_013013 [Fusarium kuroshium]|uniref:Uncharacterized protein n=1 Tax=Fusarium kuroshium TaxID=2010991 RepID=A0A3M2RRE5_9HYPO|nr:hypothetical protein CDV36_013013 [Fusarium kuroshium]
MSSKLEAISLTSDDGHNPPEDTNENADESCRSELDEPIWLSIQDFDLLGVTHQQKQFAEHLVSLFNGIKDEMNNPLASELAEFLPNAWKNWTAQVRKPNFATQDVFYSELRGTHGGRKILYYPHWFFMAACWGPAHFQLAPIRKDMSALWGVEFPTSSVFYPANIPAWRQKALFFGKRAEDTSFHEMEDRVEGFKAAIEDVDKPSIIEALTEYAPGLRNKAAYGNDAKELRNQLRDTRKQLEETQGKLEGTQTQLRNAKERLRIAEERIEDTERQLRETKTKCDSLCSKDDLITTNRRVDKVVETCALVLSILTTPGGEKRGREKQQAGD